MRCKWKQGISLLRVASLAFITLAVCACTLHPRCPLQHPFKGLFRCREGPFRTLAPSHSPKPITTTARPPCAAVLTSALSRVPSRHRQEKKSMSDEKISVPAKPLPLQHPDHVVRAFLLMPCHGRDRGRQKGQRRWTRQWQEKGRRGTDADCADCES